MRQPRVIARKAMKNLDFLAAYAIKPAHLRAKIAPQATLHWLGFNLTPALQFTEMAKFPKIMTHPAASKQRSNAIEYFGNEEKKSSVARRVLHALSSGIFSLQETSTDQKRALSVTP